MRLLSVGSTPLLVDTESPVENLNIVFEPSEIPYLHHVLASSTIAAPKPTRQSPYPWDRVKGW